MEKNMTGGLQAMHFVKAFIMSALITAMLLFLCAFLVLKSGMEEKTLGIILAAVDAIGVFIGGLYLGKKSGVHRKRRLFFTASFFVSIHSPQLEAGSLRGLPHNC